MTIRASALKLIGIPIALMVAVMIANMVTVGGITGFGLMPRSVESLHQVIFAPFIHANLAHLCSNIIALSVLSLLCIWRSPRLFVWGSVFINLSSGLMVWMFARSAVHIGASGWVFGLWSMLLAIAWWERSVKSVVIGLIVLFLYGGLSFGLLPSTPEVSFEAHIAGVISGCGVAYAFVFRSMRHNQI